MTQVSDNVSEETKREEVDVTMASREVDGHLSLQPCWEKYVKEMSPFYFNTLSELLEAFASSKIEFSPDDVHVLTEIALVFKTSSVSVKKNGEARNIVAGQNFEAGEAAYTVCGLVPIAKL